MTLVASGVLACSGPVEELTPEEMAQDIIGGTRVESWSRVQFIAAVERRDLTPGGVIDGLACGGTVVAPWWVLTAAHCVVNRLSQPVALDRLSVVVKDLNLTTVAASDRRRVTQVVVHGMYSARYGTHDLALLKLDRPVSAGFALPLDDGGLIKAGLPARVYGWGVVTGEHYQPKLSASTEPVLHEVPSDWGGADALRSAPMEVITNERCNAMYIDGLRDLGQTPTELGFPSPPIPSSMVCAVSADSVPRDHCYADSGGPLVAYDASLRRRVLIGVVNGALGCADPRFPGYYARVSQHLAFLRSHIGQ